MMKSLSVIVLAAAALVGATPLTTRDVTVRGAKATSFTATKGSIACPSDFRVTNALTTGNYAAVPKSVADAAGGCGVHLLVSNEAGGRQFDAFIVDFSPEGTIFLGPGPSGASQGASSFTADYTVLTA